MLSILPKNLRLSRRSRLQETAIRNLGGGLNVVDDDISMGPSYMPVLRNLRRNPNGSQQIRFGSSLLKDAASAVTGTIVDMEYFSDRIIAATTTGQVASINGAGVATAIWNSAIAAALPGTPAGWTNGVTSLDFVPFKQQLILHNGTDKPITFSSTFVATYLQDLVTGSNVNVPIGKYGCVVSNYHCVAGIAAAPTTVYVSSQSTAGTFVGDPAPNDSIAFDVGAYAPEGSSEIRGIAGYRTNLIIFFRGAALVIELGNYNDAGVHTPKFPDSLQNFGLLGHRAIATTIEQDLMFAGLAGVSSAKRSLFSGLLDGAFMSGNIEPLYRSAIESLTDTQRLLNCFIVRDDASHDTLLFVPPDKVFVRSAQAKLRYESWSYYTGMDWTCGCTSFLGRVFFAQGSKIYQAGNQTYANENYFADKMNDYSAVWTPSTLFVVGTVVLDPGASATDINKSWVANVTHTSGTGTFQTDRDASPDNWRRFAGKPISFELETPWIIGAEPMKTKLLRYVNAATKGSGGFTLEAYVDNLYKDEAGNVLHGPALSIDFVGNDVRGFGYDEGIASARSTEYELRSDGSYILRPDGSRVIRVADEGEGPFGSGRRSFDPRLYGFPLKYKMIKFRLTGSVRRLIQFININFAFARGNFRR
jgi:hypothetical protein